MVVYKLNLIKCTFLRRGENLSEQRRAPSNSTHIWCGVWKSNPGHVGGRQVLSPLRHHILLTQIKANVGFWAFRGNQSTWRKPLSAELRTNKLNRHMTPDLGIEPGPHYIDGRQFLSPLNHPCTPVCLVKLQVNLFLCSPLDTQVLFSENKDEKIWY